MPGWEPLDMIVKNEITQREDEGFDVGGLLQKWEAAGKDEEKLMAVYRQLQNAPSQTNFPYTEPSELADIRGQRPDGPRRIDIRQNSEQLRDQFYGAWLGRCIGCALGRPLEIGPFSSGANGKPGWENVKLWFEGADAWPIRGYTPGYSKARDKGIDVAHRCGDSFSENISFMESDDDIRYTIIGLLQMEERGLDWDSWDVGMLWHQRLAYRQVCTAETQAYLNFAHVSSHINSHVLCEKPNDWRQKIEWVRTYLNPYRELIGAQIRVDGYAYAAAGNLELAADLAWRDASFSHVKNGVYGAMYIAAMIAASFAEKDPEKIVAWALSEIPKNARLAHDIRKAIEIAKGETDQVRLVSRIWEAFKHYKPGHANNNAALCTASVLFAGDDFEKAVATAVLGGWDTDCNGATVGSIMGARLGAKNIPERWKQPLNDTLYSGIWGFHPIPISECAKRSYNTYVKLRQ